MVFFVLLCLLLFEAIAQHFESKQLVISRPPFNTTTPLTSAYYVDSTVMPKLSKLTVCIWVKPYPLALQDMSGVGPQKLIFMYHWGGMDRTDIISLIYQSDHEHLKLGNRGDEAYITSLPHGEFLNGQWKHICVRHKARGLSDVYYLDYAVSKDYVTNVSTTSSTDVLPAGTQGGSWLLFYDQDDHQSVQDPVGDFDRHQSMVGEIASFQIFSRRIVPAFFEVTGCGLRADIFDSTYDSLSQIGPGDGFSVADKEVPFCARGEGRWTPPLFDGVFTCSPGIRIAKLGSFNDSTQQNITSKQHCTRVCQPDLECTSFNFYETTRECQLSSLSLSDILSTFDRGVIALYIKPAEDSVFCFRNREVSV